MDDISDFLEDLKPRRDGDLADRFNYCYTVIILLVFSGFIAGWEYVGNPIQCWFPAEFTEYWEQYTEYYCFVQNTYFVHFAQDGLRPKSYDDMLQNFKIFPRNHPGRKKAEIPYYQWVPFILAIMGILFYMPIVAWRGLNSRVATNVNGVLSNAVTSKNIDPKNRARSMQVVAGFIHYSNEFKYSVSDNRAIRWFFSSHVAMLYILMKLLYCAISIGQLYMLNDFLVIKGYILWGPELLVDLMNGREWAESGRFPRVTFCDFEVDDLGETLEYSVQCVLMINEFNEKIFLFIWFWLFFISALNILSLIYWFITTFTFTTSHEQIKNMLQQIDPGIDLPDVKKFVRKELQANGLLVMELVRLNSGDVVVSEMLKALYRHYTASRLMNTSQRIEALSAVPDRLLSMKPETSDPDPQLASDDDEPAVIVILTPSISSNSSDDSEHNVSNAQLTPKVNLSMSSLNDQVDDKKWKKKRLRPVQKLKKQH